MVIETGDEKSMIPSISARKMNKKNTRANYP